jgi:F-type H+-transporting ATPase subunit epsilon
MILEIITPEKQLFSGEVTSVNFPGTNGEFEILNNHAPIISTLSKGEIRVTITQKDTQKFNVNGV